MSVNSERSFGAVVREIGGNVDRIVRAELRVAVAEVLVGLRAAGEAVSLLVAGAALAAFALLFFLLSALFALALVMPAWLAALVLGMLVGAGAVVLVLAGRARLPHAIAAASPTLLSPPEPVA